MKKMMVRGTLHPITESRPLVGIAERAMQRRTTKVANTSKGCSRKAVGVRWRDTLVMARGALENVTIDRLGLDRVQLRRQRTLTVGCLRSLERVQSVLRTIDVSERVALEVTARALRKAHPLVAQSHVDQRLLVVIASELIHLLSLKFVLDTFAVGRVTDQRQNGSNSLHEKSALVSICIVQRSLHTVVAV